MFKLSEEMKAELLKKFQTLEPLKEKLAFWSTELQINYIQYLELGTSDDRYNELKDFDIPIRGFEKEDFARWVIAHYHDLSTHPQKEKELLDFGVLKSRFEAKYELETDKPNYIKKRQIEIEEAFTPGSSFSTSFFGGIAQSYRPTNRFNADYTAFLRGKRDLKPEYRNIEPFLSAIKQVHNGYSLGLFWRYLDEKEKEISNPNSERIKQLLEIIDQLQKELNKKEGRPLAKGAQVLLYKHLRLPKALNEVNELQKATVEEKSEIAGAVLAMGSGTLTKNLNKLEEGGSEYETERNYNLLFEFLHEKGLHSLAQRIKAERQAKNKFL
jgi:hypothetical protein